MLASGCRHLIGMEGPAYGRCDILVNGVKQGATKSTLFYGYAPLFGYEYAEPMDTD